MPRVGTPNLNLGTYLDGEYPGAGSQSVDNDGLNGNVIKLDRAVGTEHNADGSHKANVIGTTQIVNSAVTAAKIADANVTTAKIADANVTTEKLEYKEYVAVLTQAGTAPPSVTVIKNTLGETPVSSYSGVGYYYLTTTGTIFTLNKVSVILHNDDTAVGYACAYHYTTTQIKIATNNAGTPTNSILNRATIIIRVYP